MKIPGRLKNRLILSFAMLYLAGGGYWFVHTFLKKEGEFGEEPHFMQGLLGPLHLAFAFVFIFTTGIVWTRHIKPAIRKREHRASGWLFLVFIGLLALSGIIILYGNEILINAVKPIHPWLGLILLPLLLFHSKFKKIKNHHS